MRTYKKMLGWSLIFFLTTCGSVGAQESSPDQIKECRKFVQGFYNWYVGGSHFIDDVIKYKRNAFTAELLELLKFSLPKGNDEGFGWDWDPFLTGNDPASRYSVGRITRKGDTFMVGVDPGPPAARANPKVTAEVIFKDGRWIFVNFHYLPRHPKNPTEDDLLSLLKWHKARSTPKRK